MIDAERARAHELATPYVDAIDEDSTYSWDQVHATFVDAFLRGCDFKRAEYEPQFAWANSEFNDRACEIEHERKRSRKLAADIDVWIRIGFKEEMARDSLKDYEATEIKR